MPVTVEQARSELERRRAARPPDMSPEDTWSYALRPNASLVEAMPWQVRGRYQAIRDQVTNPEEFDDQMASAAYMGYLTATDPAAIYDSPKAWARQIFNQDLTPSQIISHAISDQDSITRYIESWNSLQREIEREKEMPPWWEDVVENRAVAGVARAASGIVAGAGETLGTRVREPITGSRFASPADTQFRDTMRKHARLLWEVSKDPELAMRRDDTLNKIIAMGVETLPYITATTAASIAAGPAGLVGSFLVGATVEGNAAYQTALDSLPELRPDLSAEDQETLARTIGLGVGIISGAIESFGGAVADEAMKKATSKIVNDWIRGGVQLGVGSLIEAAEEAGQELAAITGESVYAEIDFEQAMRRTLAAAGGGLALGGVFRLGSASLRGITADSPRGIQMRALRMAAAQGELTKDMVDRFEQQVEGVLKIREEQEKAAEAEAEPAEAPTEEAPPQAQAGGITTEIVSPNLYIGNVTPRMKAKFSEVFGVKPSEVKDFLEGPFKTKRTEITMDRGQATDLLNLLKGQVEALFETTRWHYRKIDPESGLQIGKDIIRSEPLSAAEQTEQGLAFVATTTDIKANQTAEVQAMIGDIKALEEALFGGAQPAQGTIRRQKQRPVAISGKAETVPSGILESAFDKISKGEELTEEETASVQVALQQEKVAAKAVGKPLSTKQTIEAAVRPDKLEKSKETTLQIFNRVMKGKEEAAKSAYIAGARDTVKQHKNLAQFAAQKLSGLPVSEAQRSQLLKAVARARTESEQVIAMAAVQKVADDAQHKGAVVNLRKQIGSIPKRKGRIKLRQAAVDRITDALEGVDLRELSKAKRAELESIRDDLKEVGFQIEKEFTVPSEEELGGIEAVVGKRVLEQLKRLQQESIAKMSPDEINAIADSIRYAVSQNTKQTIAKREADRKRVAKQNEKAKSEIMPTKASAKVNISERVGPISIARRIFGFVRQDSMHRWSLVESATSEGLNTTAQILDQAIHDGKNRSFSKQFEALDLLRKQMDKLGWSSSDVERRSEEHSVKLGGKQYKLTTDEIMSLGMNILSDRNAAQIVKAENLHIGGRDVKTPTVAEIAEAIEEVLTDKERAVMEFLPTLNEKVLMPAINEVSEDMLGFSLATDPFYWGLKRRLPSRELRGRTISGAAIEDIGPFQPFVGSNLPLNILPFWSQVLNQVQNAASMYGMAKPMEDARSLLLDQKWQKSMKKAGREHEMQNLLKIFERMQGTRSDKDSIEILGSTLLGHSGKAILGWRISTMANQAASIPMAFTVIPNKYVAPLSGLTVQRGSAQDKRMDNYSPMIRMRHIGGRTNIITGDAGAQHAVDHLIFRRPADASLQGMRHTDRRAIKEIDVATQRWVADTTKFKHGSDNFWKEVARRSEDVIRKTQPMWDVDERSVLASNPNVLVRAMFVFRSAREAVLNQNLMAIDRLAKTKDKSAAQSHLANTLAMTTLSTSMVVGIRTALAFVTGSIAASILGLEPPDADKEPEDRAKDFGAELLKGTAEYVPLGRVMVGVVKASMRRRLFDEFDPDSILFGGVAAVGKTGGHLTGAYEAYFNDGNTEKLKTELVGAINDAADVIGRAKGIPTGGIIQLVGTPLEKTLREND